MYALVNVNLTIIHNHQHVYNQIHTLQTPHCVASRDGRFPLPQRLGVGVKNRPQILQVVVLRDKQLLDDRQPGVLLYICK